MQNELWQLARRKDNAPTAEAFRCCIRFARSRDVDETTVLAQPIWCDTEDQPLLFFHPVHPPPGASRIEGPCDGVRAPTP